MFFCFDDVCKEETNLNFVVFYMDALTINMLILLDVGNWKEGGGRGAMLQSSPSKDPPSPQSSPQQNPIEIQQNGPPITSSTMDTPSPQMQQPMSLRPGGGPMHMGPPPMGIPPQYRGMMPPYVSVPPYNHFVGLSIQALS